MTTLLSVSRRPHFFMWTDEHIKICVQITTLSSVWHVNGARRLSSLWESYLTIFCKVQWGDLTSTHHLYLLRSTRQHDFKRAHVHELVEATDSAFPQYFNQPAAAGGQEMLEWSLYSGAKPGHCIYIIFFLRFVQTLSTKSQAKLYHLCRNLVQPFLPSPLSEGQKVVNNKSGGLLTNWPGVALGDQHFYILHSSCSFFLPLTVFWSTLSNSRYKFGSFWPGAQVPGAQVPGDQVPGDQVYWWNEGSHLSPVHGLCGTSVGGCRPVANTTCGNVQNIHSIQRVFKELH